MATDKSEGGKTSEKKEVAPRMRPVEPKQKSDVGITEVTKSADKKPKPELKSAPAKSVSAPKAQSKSVHTEPMKALPKITLDVYLLAKRVKPDQTAGFRRWMKDRKVRRQMMTEWDKVWDEFQTRPITNRR